MVDRSGQIFNQRPDQGGYRGLEPASHYSLQSSHFSQSEIVPIMSQNSQSDFSRNKVPVPHPQQLSWALPPPAQPEPPVLIGPNYIVLFNSNANQVAGTLPPNFHFVGQPKPQLPQYDPNIGLFNYGSSNVGIEYDYTTIYDPSYGVPAFVSDSAIGAQMVQTLNPRHELNYQHQQYPPMGTMYYAQPLSAINSQAVPEFSRTTTEVASIPSQSDSVEGVSVASASTASSTTSPIKLNPNAPEYIPKSLQSVVTQTQTQTMPSFFNKSWSEQMESHDSRERHSPPQSGQEPLRSSTPIFSNTTYHSPPDGQNRSRRGSSDSFRGRAGYIPRGAHSWNNYDDEGGRYHYEDQEQGYLYRGRGGRGRGGRGRGRGGRGRGSQYREDYYDQDGYSRQYQENFEFSNEGNNIGAKRRTEISRMPCQPLPGAPVDLKLPSQVTLPGPFSYASALSSGLAPLGSAPKPPSKPVETAEEPIIQSTYVNSAFKGHGGRSGGQSDRGNLLWINRNLVEIKTEDSSAFPAEPSVQNETQNHKVNTNEKAAANVDKQYVKKEENCEKSEDDGNGSGEDIPAIATANSDTNNNESQLKHVSTGTEINAGDGIGIGDLASNDNNSANTGLATVEGAKGEPATITQEKRQLI